MRILHVLFIIIVELFFKYLFVALYIGEPCCILSLSDQKFYPPNFYDIPLPNWDSFLGFIFIFEASYNEVNFLVIFFAAFRKNVILILD